MVFSGITTVALVEDNSGYRRTLEQLINDTPGLRCGCACSTAEQALRLIPRQPPDVVLMDIHLPNRSGIECIGQLKQKLPDLFVIMLTVHDDIEVIFKAIKAGASGYLLKRSKPDEIIAAIEQVRNGGAPMNSEIARKILTALQEPAPPHPLANVLSRREQEILELLSQGFSNRDIAQNLSLSVETVRVHLRHIYEKFHVSSRTQAIAKFMGSGAAKPSLPHPPADHHKSGQ